MLEAAALAIFAALMIGPALYGLHMYLLMFLAGRRRRHVRAMQRAVRADYRPRVWPRVTTQIPIYNESAVAERVIRAVAGLDYPRDRHEIQVLDDSTDGTRALVDQVCDRLRGEGHEIVVLRREVRTDFKAGALAAGLRRATGDLIAIFDADFVPGPGFLKELVPLLESDARVACVQGRWGHLNQNESWMTEALSLGMDGHFGVEQPARAWNGFLLNFNGTGGIWRRAAIEDPAVGGWQGDTLTEDLDLSYRAQLAGWTIRYCQDVEAPAEVPADVAALKSQQRRWATGSMQSARKLLPLVWKSKLSLATRVEASIHLTQYLVNVFMVMMALFGRSLFWFIPVERYADWLAVSWIVILLAAAAPSVAYMFGRWSLQGQIPGPGRILQLIALGFGLSLNNTVACAVGLFSRGGEFVRTPKTGSTGTRAGQRRYAVPGGLLWLAEILLGLFCLAQWAWFLEADRYVGGTFLLLFAAGLLTIGWQSRPHGATESSDPLPAEGKLAAAGEVGK